MTVPKCFVVLLLQLICCIPPAACARHASALAKEDRPATERVADERHVGVVNAVRAGMQEHDVPGVSIAIFDDYRTVWCEGFGIVAEGAAKRATVETRFQAASISKPIAAIAALRLVEQGKLDLDAKVNDQLTSWTIPETPVTKKSPIKLRHLLSHYAGLTVHGFEGYPVGEKTPTLLEILDGQPPANSTAVRTLMRPAYRFKYSGGGYCVVQQLLIDVTGEPFPKLMQELVLKPAGMKHSTYEQPLPESLVSVAAVGHRAQRKPLAGQWHVYPEMAAAGLWTTPSDLVLAAIDVSKSYTGAGGKLLSQKMARTMLTPENPVFGLGFTIKGTGQQLAFMHGGSNEGFRCQLIAYPETGQGLAIMTNSDTGSMIFRNVINAARKAYGWPADKVSDEE